MINISRSSSIQKCYLEVLSRGYISINSFTRGVLSKSCSGKGVRNFTEITLRHGYALVNLQHIVRIPFTKNTSERLLLYLLICFSRKPLPIVHIFTSIMWYQEKVTRKKSLLLISGGKGEWQKRELLRLMLYKQILLFIIFV